MLKYRLKASKLFSSTRTHIPFKYNKSVCARACVCVGFGQKNAFSRTKKKRTIAAALPRTRCEKGKDGGAEKQEMERRGGGSVARPSAR